MAARIHIRQVTPDDAKVLLKIAKKTFYDTYHFMNDSDNFERYLEENFTLEKIRTEIQDSQSLFFFVCEANHIHGYIKLNWGDAQSEDKVDTALEIERIYVLKGSQSRGIGKILLEKAREVAIERNLRTIWLGVWEKNPDAIRFYQREGFRKFDTHIFTVGDDDQVDIMMKQEI